MIDGNKFLYQIYLSDVYLMKNENWKNKARGKIVGKISRGARDWF